MHSGVCPDWGIEPTTSAPGGCHSNQLNYLASASFLFYFRLDDFWGNFHKRYFVILNHVHIQHSINTALSSCPQSTFLPRGLCTCYSLVLLDDSLDGHGLLPHLGPCSNITSSEQPFLVSPSKNSTVTTPFPYFFPVARNHGLTLHAGLAPGMSVRRRLHVLFTAVSSDSGTS